MQNNTPKKSKKFLKLKIALIALAVILLTGYIIWDIISFGPLSKLYSNRERLIEIVRNLGPLGPLAFIALQILQTVVAPIPSNVVSIIGGSLFGWWGILWTTIGSTIGASIVFYISRRFGRKLVEKLVKPETLKKVDFIIGKRAGLMIFLVFLLPGLPDDIVCYIAGLTDVPLRRLVAIFAIGRLPAVIANNYIGLGLSGGADVKIVGAVSIVIVLIVAIFYKQQEKILQILGKQKQIEADTQFLQKSINDLADDGKINNSIAKKPKKH